MKNHAIHGCLLATALLTACASKATDEAISKMCDTKLEVTGVLRGTEYEEEAARIEKEYADKEAGLKAEMDRDLKGMDDVLAGRLKAIEEEAGASAGAGNEQDPDEIKAERIKVAKEEIEKKKRAIIEQFEPLIAQLAPQREYALEGTREYVEKRNGAAEQEKAACVAQAQKAGVSSAVAACRIEAATAEAYDACK